MNRRTLKSEKSLSSSPSRKSALNISSSQHLALAAYSPALLARWLVNRIEFACQDALKRRELRLQRESKTQIFTKRTAGFCRFTPSPGNSSIWRAQNFRRKPKFLAGIFFSDRKVGLNNTQFQRLWGMSDFFIVSDQTPNHFTDK